MESQETKFYSGIVYLTNRIYANQREGESGGTRRIIITGTVVIIPLRNAIKGTTGEAQVLKMSFGPFGLRLCQLGADFMGY